MRINFANAGFLRRNGHDDRPSIESLHNVFGLFKRQRVQRGAKSVGERAVAGDHGHLHTAGRIEAKPRPRIDDVAVAATIDLDPLLRIARC